jgi:HK97 family phage prohead protease
MTRLTFASTITAADTATRTITGQIVPFNAPGNTSAGAVIFAPGSITISADKKTKLFADHDSRHVLGSMISHEITDTGITASFKIANTPEGDTALVLASEGLKDGLSVGVEVKAAKPKDGTLVVSQSHLVEVSLVESAAFGDLAQVSKVAASEPEPEAPPTETPTTEEEEEMSEQTPEAETVEASAPKTVPYMSQTLRSPVVDKLSYLEHSLRASILHDEESRNYIRAADNTTSTVPGMIPTPQSTTIINALSNGERGMIDALSRETLQAEGMTFELPKISAVPTVEVVAEGTSVTESSLSASYISVAVESFKGRAISTVELIDRSNPAYLAALLQQLEFAYAAATDLYATEAIAAASGSTGNNANTAAGFLGYTTEASGDVYTDSLGFARNIVVSPAQWSKIMSYNDNGRPIYNAQFPQNAGGNVTAQSLTGFVAPGLNLFVSRSIGVATGTTTDADKSMLVVNPTSYTWYEASRFQLRTNVASDGTIDILYYGYAALGEKVSGGAVWNAVA